jgi:tetratricopeptide (TPR) repeat protein
MAIAIVFISAAMGTWFTFGKQYVAQASFAQAQATETDPAALDQAALASFLLYPDDQFLSVRARLALLEMNQILTIAEPSETDQQRFLVVSNQAVTFADASVSQSGTEPSHYAVLAGIYNNLAISGIADAVGRATSSIAAAQALDPLNPTYALLTAQLAANRGDATSSRAALLQALQQKSNFSEALYLLAQLDIAEGNVESAISTTETIIRLEPNNPTRYYQLGILHSSADNLAAAKQSYETAIRLDPNFANAKIVTSIYNERNKTSFDSLMGHKAVLDGVDIPDVGRIANPTVENINKFAAEWSDAIIYGSENLDDDLKDLEKDMKKLKKKYDK